MRTTPPIQEDVAERIRSSPKPFRVHSHPAASHRFEGRVIGKSGRVSGFVSIRAAHDCFAGISALPPRPDPAIMISALAC